ncbi:MAG: hypothetical protein AABX54_00665 [Nanoarchaeota archaeon]
MKNLRVHPKIEPGHIDEIMLIDQEAFGESSSPTAIRNAERNPWAYTVLSLNDHVLGYGLVLPIDRFAREALVRGEISEDEVMARHVLLPDNCDAFYIASIATRQNTLPVFRSRLVGYTLGSVLRAPKLTLAVAVSRDGDSIAREIGLEPRGLYVSQFKGIHEYNPTLFLREAFNFNRN